MRKRIDLFKKRIESFRKRIELMGKRIEKTYKRIGFIHNAFYKMDKTRHFGLLVEKGNR